MINKQISSIIEYKEEYVLERTLRISNSIIERLYFPAFAISQNIIIENCIIRNLIIYNAWFAKGFTLRNSIIKNKIEYEAGGHNKCPFIMENNVFEDYVNFFDCQFEDDVFICNNLFIKGSNLLLKENHFTDPSFKKAPVIENNIGKLDITCSEPMNL